MSDVRMGLKHVILQRMQKSDARMIKSEQKPPTDFSIKRILDGIPLGKDITKTSSDILDLSKTRSTTENQGYTVPNSQYLGGSEVCQSLPSGVRCHQRPVFSDFVVKPKVFKFWEHGSFDSNCNGCELYFKNINYPPVFYGNNTWSKAGFSQGTGLIQNFAGKSVNVNLINPQITDDEVSYKCQTCDKVFGCAATLQSHEKTHKSPRYECTDCGKGFSQLRNYKYHLSVHRGTKEFAAECPECGKIFNDKGYLSSHMKIHRNKKEYECPYCPKSFNQRVAFNMHVRIHTGVKPHKCTECGKRFSRKMLLKQHMRTHSGEKPYQCSVCGKSFADRSNMTLHHRLHSGIKPFSCPICPKAFTKKHHLKTHLNYHTGCKPYVCPHPNCNQAFTQSSNMRTHAKKCQFRPSEIYTTLSPSL